jgi:hypothetical protein
VREHKLWLGSNRDGLWFPNCCLLQVVRSEERQEHPTSNGKHLIDLSRLVVGVACLLRDYRATPF